MTTYRLSARLDIRGLADFLDQPQRVKGAKSLAQKLRNVADAERIVSLADDEAKVFRIVCQSTEYTEETTP